jgi:ATP-dependent exoDNAse (exonuclease V) beta subunit
LLVSADDPEVLKRSVPELMAERAQLLSDDGSSRVQGLLKALEDAPALRFARPTKQVGTWLEQVWLRLGGAECVNEGQRANLDLLWSTLDGLADGEQDLLGPALDSALNALTAVPDASVRNDLGVQLMTIHKAKGLEFEVVIVPELQSRTRKDRQEMLSWLERGLIEPDEWGETTEFLVAPRQAKGADKGTAKAWVDHEYCARERQEIRRLLYVAATRAREELHFFARPEYKQGADGLELAQPRESLLKTTWPAFGQEIELQFDTWRREREGELQGLAAEAATVAAIRPDVPAGNRGTVLRRLPANWRGRASEVAARSIEPPIAGLGRLYNRHEGGLVSRALGRAVHLLLQQAALLRREQPWSEVTSKLDLLRPRVTAEIRAAGVERSGAAKMADQAAAIAIEAINDAAGRWILEPRDEAQSEIRWAGVAGGAVRTVQADRVFKAGAEPLSETGDVWWIVDYKTAHEDGVELADLRGFFKPQLEAYGRVLRNLRGSDAKVCAGLYYPRMKKLDCWEM